MAKKPRNVHDRAFKALFHPPEAALSLLRSTLPAELVEAIDPGSIQPGPTDFSNDLLEEDHRDLLFEATIRGRHVLFYVIEHQRKVEWFMALRLLRYVIGVWDWWLSKHPGTKTLPAVIPLVLHQGDKAWDAPRSLAALMDLPPDVLAAVGPYVPALAMALQDLGPRSPAELAVFPGPPIVRVTLTFMRAVVDPRGDPLAALESLQETLRELLAQPGGRARLAVVLRYTVLARPELDVQSVVEEFRRVAGSEAGEVVMSTAQELIKEGREQERREFVELLLTEKFGELTQEVRDRLDKASADELQHWGKRVLRAERIEDVFAS